MNTPEIDHKNKCFLIKENSMSWGKLIVNPRVLYTLTNNGEKSIERVGDFDNPRQDTFHYLVHRTYGVPIKDNSRYHVDHDVIIKVEYIMNDGNYNQVDFVFNLANGQWEEL